MARWICALRACHRNNPTPMASISTYWSCRMWQSQRLARLHAVAEQSGRVRADRRSIELCIHEPIDIDAQTQLFKI